ncbi:protein ENL isoform X4 [Danio aesculapii]|uniref:protein ENL isoform X4 n=1 Tax=Danio aesculapii TaxID=1142201 RepID=UPI0024BF2EDB|nr:protein ENL isoform X4 [Danio aesculapii]
MENQCTVQVKLELGHRAQLRKKVTSEGFTHDWMVFVRGPEGSDIQHFVDKVVFRLHESFPKPKRVCKEPQYKVEESGYAGFLMPIEVYFKNKEEPKKVCFNYDLFLNLEGNPPVNHLRCEKLTFNNPTRDFRRKLVKAGGLIVVPEGAEVVPRPSPDYPMLPTIPLSAFSDPKKSKTSQGSKEPSKEGSKVSKSHKMAKEHRERPRKDSESKATSKGDSERDGSSKTSRDPSSSSSSSSKKTEIKVKDDNKVLPKAAFKEPKLTLKESKMESMSPKGGGAGVAGGGGGGGAADGKAPSKRPSNAESPKPSAKKPKKGSSEGSKGSGSGGFTGASPRTASSSNTSSGYAEKKTSKEKGRWAKGKSEAQEVKETKKPPESDDSNSDDEASSKSESAPSSPSNSSSSSESSSDSDFEPEQKQGQGPLQSMLEDLQSEESDDDDSSSDEETPVKNNLPSRDSRLSVDSESDCSDGPQRPSRDAPPQLPKHSSTNNKVSGRKSPDPCLRQEKVLKKGYDKAYTDELVELHRRLMALRERNVLQQIVNLIEETGHFNVTNTTFDFDLFSLDESTVRKLQSYLEATTT